MAKTESTAVNDLINLVQGGSSPQAVSEPGADLFSAPKSIKVNPPRMTSPIPALRGAGEVEPLPRRRAPNATSKQSATPAEPSPVRISTADPTLGATIPPLARPTTKPTARASSPQRPRTPRATTAAPAQRPSGTPPQRTSMARASASLPVQQRPTVPSAPPPQRARASASLPVQQRPTMPSAPPPQRARASASLPVQQRPTMPSAPPPQRARASLPVQQRPTMPSPPPPQRASTSTSLPIQQRATVPSVPPPATVPVAAPFDARRVEASPLPSLGLPQFPIVAPPQTFDAGGLVQADNWLDTSGTVRKGITSTHVVPRPLPQDTIALIKKMIVPTLLLAIVGVAVGGYFALNGDDGNQKPAPRAAESASAETTVRMPVTATATAPSPESINAGTASAGGAQPEPPTKAEQVARQAAAAAEEAKASESMLPAATTAALVREAAPAVAQPAPAPVAAPAVATSEPAPVASPAVREVQTSRGIVKLVDVRIDSTPPGATVMLVDNGTSSFLGSTPLATSLDPSRKYDVIFTLPGRPTQMAPLDPATMSRLDVTLGRGKSERRAKKESAPAPLGDKAEKAVADKAEPAGEGTLMVSSKPPCEILIDGKATGLTTPQRSIPLPAGTHKITFVNEAAGIKKTVSVTINADQPTKLIQDLMN